MLRRFLSLCLITAGLAAAAGCAASRGARDAAPAPEESERMVAQAQRRLAQKPGDPAAMRDLGIGLYRLGRFDESLEALKQARSFRPDDRLGLFFEARCLDTLGHTPKALEAYGSYLARAKGREAATVRARMEQLRRVLIREEVVHAIARESEIAAAEIPEGTVAVPDFLTPSESDTLRALAKGLAVMVLTDLAQVEQLRVVERQRISTLLAEMRLAQSAMVRVRTEEGPDALASVRGQKQRLARLSDPQTGKAFYDGPVDDDAGEAFLDAVRAFQASAGLTADGVVGPRTRTALEEAWNRLPPEDREVGARAVAVFDPNTVPRVGRLLGAREIVQGSVLPVGREEVQISADLVPVVSGGRTGSTEAVEGEIEEVLTLQERLVYSILDALGIEPTREERKRIGRQETDSFAAFFAYCRGLDLEDQGRHGEALSLYERALSIDPGFRMAAEAAAVISTGPDDLGAIESGSAPSTPAAGGGDAATRAAGTAGRVGLMPMFDPLPQIDPVTPDPVRAESENGRIIVIGEIPGSGGGKP